MDKAGVYQFPQQACRARRENARDMLPKYPAWKLQLSPGFNMDHSLYIHIPFCRHRCAYCDFNTYAGQEDSIPAYVDALCREIEIVGRNAPARIAVHTVFFGGGTPSLLSPKQFKAILNTIHLHFDLGDGTEITIEANPGTVTSDDLGELRGLGVNRISFGAQSANTEELRMLERSHTFLQVIEALYGARRAGFDNLNLDLIYGLPEQSLESWKATLERVLDLRPEHISAYALTLEHGTPFGHWSTRGLLPIPDPDTAAEMYEWGCGAMETAGYVQYEISNWGRDERVDRRTKPVMNVAKSTLLHMPRFACRHNLQYWRCLPYLGFGAGAHGYAYGYRYSNVLRIKSYIDRLNEYYAAQIGHSGQLGGNGLEPGDAKFPLSPATVNQHHQTLEDDMSEFLIMGLRLTHEGVSPTRFRERFDRALEDVYGNEIKELERVGLMESARLETSEAEGTSEVLRLTDRGRLLGNQVFVRFV